MDSIKSILCKGFMYVGKCGNILFVKYEIPFCDKSILMFSNDIVNSPNKGRAIAKVVIDTALIQSLPLLL